MLMEDMILSGYACKFGPNKVQNLLGYGYLMKSRSQRMLDCKGVKDAMNTAPAYHTKAEEALQTMEDRMQQREWRLEHQIEPMGVICLQTMEHQHGRGIDARLQGVCEHDLVALVFESL